MTTEEKAKAYDEALKRAKAKMEEANGFDYDDEQTAHVIRLTTTDIFPELAESKNEKIRKAIKKALQVRCDGSRIISDEPVTLEEAISWLEKQGEQKPKELFDIPENGIENDVSVTSRLEHISEQLKPIAKFILHYAHWNLHKDEWNHPVPEVPLFRVLDALVQEGKPYQGCDSCIEQKFAEWGEEDNIILSRIIADYERSNEEWFNAQNSLPHGRKINWLKSLRPQKQEQWNEQDIEMIDWLIRCCEKEYEELCNDRYGHQEIVSDLKRDCRKKWDWMESLKSKVVPQKQWKPSEEQMNELHKVITHAYFNLDVIDSLYQDLKAL